MSKAAKQFGPVASNYATSVGHNDASALRRLVEVSGLTGGEAVLDVATGAGNTALAFAVAARSVVALDLTREMLQETERRAVESRLENVSTVLAPAEALPFEHGCFDVVVIRLAAHHFTDVRAALSESARVLRAGGRLVVVDIVAPDDVELDAEMNAIEVLRDPSHIKNYSPREWRELVEGVGLTIGSLEVGAYSEGGTVDFDQWTARIGTPRENVPVLRELFRSASAGLRASMSIRVEDEKISFLLPQMTLVAVKGSR